MFTIEKKRKCSFIHRHERGTDILYTHCYRVFRENGNG